MQLQVPRNQCTLLASEGTTNRKVYTSPPPPPAAAALSSLLLLLLVVLVTLALKKITLTIPQQVLFYDHIQVFKI
jgi:hypothetical protein